MCHRTRQQLPSIQPTKSPVSKTQTHTFHHNRLHAPSYNRDTHRDIPVKKRICRRTLAHLESFLHPRCLPPDNRCRVRTFCRSIRGCSSDLFCRQATSSGRRTRGRCSRGGLQRIRANHDRNRNHRFITFPDNHNWSLPSCPALQQQGRDGGARLVSRLPRFCLLLLPVQRVAPSRPLHVTLGPMHTRPTRFPLAFRHLLRAPVSPRLFPCHRTTGTRTNL